MMRFLFLALFSVSAMAGTSIDLQKVTLGAFCRVVFADVLKKSFVLDASVVNDADLISVTLLNRSDVELEKEARRVLDLRGYRVEDSPVLVISAKEKKSLDVSGYEMLIYRPRYRSMTYLLTLAQGLVKVGDFVGRQSSIGFSQLSGGVNPGMQAPGQTQLASGQADQGLNRATNTDQDLIVYNGPVSEISKMKKLFDAVDVAAGELLVKAMVLEVQTTNREGSAVDFVAGALQAGFGLNV